MPRLKPYHTKGIIEAGCDEAGRACLAGPVFAAAVILPPGFRDKTLNDSKQLSEPERYRLRDVVKKHAIAWAVGSVDHTEIDRINILNASFLAMHRALDQLKEQPQVLLIDGNRFNRYKDIPHHCIIEGDAKYLSIAAASVLAKTYRDDFMKKLHKKHPAYKWNTNKGYPTPEHRKALTEHGITDYHRKSFRLIYDDQVELELA